MQPTEKKGTGAISVLIAEDHPLMRKAIHVTLETEPDINIVGEVGDGEEAVNATGQLQPDIVIMDITLPKLNGIQATKKIKTLYPDTAVLVLTVHDDIEHICAMFDAGATGYLTKNILEQDLVNSIHRVLSGETILATPDFRNVLKSMQDLNRPVALGNMEKISARHLQILKLVAKGLRNRDIAYRLNLSPLTVKTYMVEIFSKLNVMSRTEAVAVALRMGLLTLHDINQGVVDE